MNTQNPMVSRNYAESKASEAAFLAKKKANDENEKRSLQVAAQIAQYMGLINSELIRMDHAVDKAVAAAIVLCGDDGPGPVGDPEPTGLPDPVALSVEYIAGVTRSMSEMTARIETMTAWFVGRRGYPQIIADMETQIETLVAAQHPGPVVDDESDENTGETPAGAGG